MKTLNNTVFFANTPLINKNRLIAFMQLPRTIKNNISGRLAYWRLERQYGAPPSTPVQAPISASSFISSPLPSVSETVISNLNSLPVSAMRSLAPGIYAKESADGTGYLRITIDAVFEPRTIIFEGKAYEVYFPKGY